MNFTLSNSHLEVEINLTKVGIKIIEHDQADVELEFSNLRKKTAEDLFDIDFQEGLLTIREKNWRKSFMSPDFMGGDANTELTLRIPKGTRFRGKIATVSGPITADNLNFIGKIRTISGGMKFGEVNSNRLRIHNVGGSMTIETLNGSLSAKIISGNCTIRSGNINFLSLTTVSGDVSIAGKLMLKENGSVNTVSGDIDLDIQEYTGDFSLILSTLSGRTAIQGEYPPDKVQIKRRMPMLKNHPFKSIMPFMKNVVSSFSHVMDDSDDIEVETETSESNEKHVQTILDMLADGKITAEEAERLINALKG